MPTYFVPRDRRNTNMPVRFVRRDRQRNRQNNDFLVIIGFILFGLALKGTEPLPCNNSSLSCELDGVSSHNNIETLIGGANNLVNLIIRRSAVHSIPKNLFTNLSSLNTLVIESCEVHTLNKNDFENANELRTLRLPANRMRPLLGRVFELAKNLEELDLSRNMLAELTADLFEGLSNLKILRLTSNRIKHIPDKIFEPLKSLTNLYLDENNLENFDGNIIESNKNLQYISLRKNRLIVFQPNSLKNFPNMELLDVSYNTIKMFQTFSVKKLIINDMNLINCIVNGFVNKLIAGNNKLKTISIENVTNLIEVDLHNNLFSNLNDFANAGNLRELDISGNPIQINKNTFEKFSALNSLNLSSMKITNLEIGTFNEQRLLQTLSLSKNNLSTLNLAVFEPLTELSVLYIDENRLEKLNCIELRKYCPKLKKMKIGKNNWSCTELSSIQKCLREYNITFEIEEFNENDDPKCKNSSDISQILDTSTQNSKAASSNTENTVPPKIEDDISSTTKSPINNLGEILILEEKIHESSDLLGKVKPGNDEKEYKVIEDLHEIKEEQAKPKETPTSNSTTNTLVLLTFLIVLAVLLVKFINFLRNRNYFGFRMYFNGYSNASNLTTDADDL